MGLLTPKGKKDGKNASKNNAKNNAQGSKFISKSNRPSGNVVKKGMMTGGSQRGS